MRRRRFSSFAVLVVAAGLVVSGAAASRASGAAPSWQSPTPADGTVLTAKAGTPFSISLAASTPDPTELVRIDAASLPAGATLSTLDGNPATAELDWTPAADQTGERALIFTATSGIDPSQTSSLRVVVRVVAPVFPLAGPGDLSHWAQVMRPTIARTAPSRTAPVVARVGTLTGEFLPTVLSLLAQKTDASGQTWVRVRLAILPNGSTGWVPQTALGAYHELHTRVVVERARLRLTFFRDGLPLFRAPIGIGKPEWPTPRGEFYVREKLTNFGDPFYGPILFGTSARSGVLTDWPGGGYIGIHGTSLPQLLPGRVSHGCIRLRNRDIVRLARLMPIGTLLTVR